MESTHRDIVQAWLGLQTSMVAGVTRAAVFLGISELDPTQPAAIWPEQTTVTPSMSAAAQQAARQRHQVINSVAMAAGSDVEQACDVVACPLIVDARLIGTVCVEMTARSEAKQRAAMQVLFWGMAWLEQLIRHLDSSSTRRLTIVVETIAKAVAHDHFLASATAVVNELARQLTCARVSVGFREGEEVRVAAISNTARLEERANLVRATAAAMNEAVDQDKCVLVPAADGDQVLTLAHEQLKAQFGSPAICSIPLSHDGSVMGAMTFEHSGDRQFEPQTVSLCETVASIAGPILQAKRLAQLSWVTRSRNALRAQTGKLFGQGHLSLKVSAAALAGLLLFLTFASGEYRVDADAKLEGTIQRAVVAPFDGYLAEAPVRAGDIVAQGQLLSRLDDRDLRLELAKWSGERAQLIKAQREALAKHERAELSILQARLDQAEAELALVEEKLARTRLTAPLDGIVVTGDLSQSLGAPLQRGEVLFEVAPLDGYRIMLEVDERDIAHVQSGQQGELALSGFPHAFHAFTVERILPISTAEDGQNFFLVEARLEDDAESLRPGMAGVGKIDAGERRLIWIWTHGLIDWFRLALWKWWG
jgi:RND family efflux transporter MFP subunit